MSDSDVVLGHYRRLAERYDDYLSYSGDFLPALTTVMVKKLELRPQDRFVDLGGGTGLYTAAILDQVPLEHPPLIVDPVAEMLDLVPPDLPARRLRADALEFAGRPDASFDKVLMKESIHHIGDRLLLFQRLYERLAPGGAVLLVHVPPWIDYPLFDAALERAVTWHADPAELVALLHESGFAVEQDVFEYQHVIPKERYLTMVANRYMSVLSTLDAAELDAGLAEMEQRHADETALAFTDRFDLVIGRKTPHGT